MKKTIYVFCVLLIPILFTGCSQSKNVSSSKIITACYVSKDGGGTKYGFYVSEPEKSEEEEPPDNNGFLKMVYSSDFNTAITKFEEMYGEFDMTHMSAIFVDVGYLSEEFINDLPAIRKHIRISPTVKCFAVGQKCESIAEGLEKTYNKSTGEYIDSAWRKDRKKLLCTLSELTFAAENPLYTASLPVVSISPENGAIQSVAFVFYNINQGVISVSDKDYEIYTQHLQKYGKTSKSLKLYPDYDVIRVRVSSIKKNSSKMAEMAEKYTALGFDFMNVFYYSKKYFPDYMSYYDYIKNMDHTNISYE